MKKTILIIYFFWLSNLFGLEVKLEKIVEGMNKPWSLSFIDDTSIIYTEKKGKLFHFCLLYTSPSPRDLSTSRMPSSA